MAYQSSFHEAHGGDEDPNDTRTSVAQRRQGHPQARDHGGDLDPNDLRPRRHPMSSQDDHGGDNDPNEIRQQQRQIQQQGSQNSQTPPTGAWQGYANSRTTSSSSGPALVRNMANVPPSTSSIAGVAPQGYQAPPSPPTMATQYPQASPGSLGSVTSMPNWPGNQPPSHPPTPSSPYQIGSTGLPTPTGQRANTFGTPQSSPQQPNAGFAPPPQNWGPQANQTWAQSQPSLMSAQGKPGIQPQDGLVKYVGTPERGYGNVLNWSTTHGSYRIKFPNIFHTARQLRERKGYRHHRDVLSRAKAYDNEDYYLSPSDGHLAKLFVQCSQEIYEADKSGTAEWRRTFIRNMSPFMLRVANFVLDTVPEDGRSMTGAELAHVCLWWVPCCCLLFVLMAYPTNVSGEVRNNGGYDPFPYRYWGYAMHARNVKEQRPQRLQPGEKSTNQAVGTSGLSPIAERPNQPKSLCFVESNGKPRLVETWKAEHPGETPSYVFVSYTSEQFKVPGDSEEARAATKQCQLLLHDAGMRAARLADVPAYWVGCSNLGSGPELAQNVWQISDIIRGARQLVIVVSDPPHNHVQNTPTQTLLADWGTRVWTLPEVLLISGNENILVFSRNHGTRNAEQVHLKREFASTMTDARISRQLLDHFDGSLVLGQLPLVTIALQCFNNRQKGDYLPGDMSYAMMGLMLRRPNIVRSDSAFQAFARLSLANDNELLLERLICVMPKSRSQPWHDMSDQWDVQLWDIYPSTQVCGIGDNDTVILDGAHAAAIRWKAFAQVATLTQDSWRRFFTRYAFRSSSWLLITGAAFIIPGGVLRAIGGVFLAISLVFIALSPYLIHVLYTGKLWGQQAWFFGFEGYMPLAAIEKHILGADLGRLNWSVAGSPLSRHRPMEHHGAEERDPAMAPPSPPDDAKVFTEECEALDPTSDPETAARVKAAVTSKMGEEKIFTLVDTKTMTVTMFAAVRPPVAVVLAGSEGGMRRALLCSYKYETQTLVRESVVRMETPVEDDMQRLGRFKFGMGR